MKAEAEERSRPRSGAQMEDSGQFPSRNRTNRGIPNRGFTVCTVLLQHSLTGPMRISRRCSSLPPVASSCYPSAPKMLSIPPGALRSSSGRQGCSSVGNCTFLSFHFPCTIGVMVTTSQPFLPGECSRVCKKLFSQAKIWHFLFTKIYVTSDLRSH